MYNRMETIIYSVHVSVYVSTECISTMYVSTMYVSTMYVSTEYFSTMYVSTMYISTVLNSVEIFIILCEAENIRR